MSAGQHERYQELRKSYPEFIFEGFNYSLKENGVEARFHFSVPGLVDFTPGFRLNASPDGKIKKEELHNFVFQIGLIELISYWKAVCSPRVLIRCGKLTAEQVAWWKDLYFNGLGEFFYRNGIPASTGDFMNIRSEGKPACKPVGFTDSGKIMVPVGGGKDSAVTLGLLGKSGYDLVPFMINPGPAQRRCVSVAGAGSHEIVVERGFDQRLLELNARGFLNGHTPFSALVAFYSSLSAFVTGISRIALSNESSASEATIPGTNINHQYSKSLDFEKKFREYSKKCLSPGIDYFSFLRPLSELQIARLFSAMKPFHPVFRSCNEDSKTDSWCGSCPKCLFTEIILAPFLNPEERFKIFGKSLLSDAMLKPLMQELTGITGQKPFECVGTMEEVKLALSKAYSGYEEREAPVLLKEFAASGAVDHNNWDQALGHIRPDHFVPDDLIQIITKSLSE